MKDCTCCTWPGLLNSVMSPICSGRMPLPNAIVQLTSTSESDGLNAAGAPSPALGPTYATMLSRPANVLVRRPICDPTFSHSIGVASARVAECLMCAIWYPSVVCAYGIIISGKKLRRGWAPNEPTLPVPGLFRSWLDGTLHRTP